MTILERMIVTNCKMIRIIRDEKNNRIEIRLGPVAQASIWVYGCEGSTPEVIDQTLAEARAAERSSFWKKTA